MQSRCSTSGTIGPRPDGSTGGGAQPQSGACATSALDQPAAVAASRSRGAGVWAGRRAAPCGQRRAQAVGCERHGLRRRGPTPQGVPSRQNRRINTRPRLTISDQLCWHPLNLERYRED
eukprot:scaffold67092_cov61-Phaeocystis_antarctica.AAC.4